jgi:hypothetical protein
MEPLCQGEYDNSKMERLIEVRLYGELRRYASPAVRGRGTVMYLPAKGSETVGQVLAQLRIDLAQVGNMFLNGRILPRSSYPVLLGYPVAADGPLSADDCLKTFVQPGDRLGIFPRNMAAVVV